jgi:hypothetical protein
MDGWIAERPKLLIKSENTYKQNKNKNGKWRVEAESRKEKKEDDDVNPVKNNETQQRKGTQDRSMDIFEWKTSTRCL